MLSRRLIAHELAATLLAGGWSARSLEARASAYLGTNTKRWQRHLIADVIETRTPYPPSPVRLARMLADSAYFDRAAALVLRREMPPPLVLDPPAFAPAPAFAAMHAPRIETIGDLARWLGTHIERLDWLADQRRQHGRAEFPILQHYHYRFTPKRGGGAPRLIEAPKQHLKALQRRILSGILNLAPVHPTAHGFVRGASRARICMRASMWSSAPTSRTSFPASAPREFTACFAASATPLAWRDRSPAYVQP